MLSNTLHNCPQMETKMSSTGINKLDAVNLVICNSTDELDITRLHEIIMDSFMHHVISLMSTV